MTAHSAPLMTFFALRVRDFRLYFIGQMISVSGTWMQRVAQGWLVFSLTGSALNLGIAAFASGIPALLLMPFAGVLADRYPRRIILFLTQLAELIVAFMLGALVLTGTVRFEHVVLCTLALGVTTALGEPARQAFMRELTGDAALNSGLALNALMSNIAGVVGPAFAGVLLITVGAGWCFILNAASYLAVLASLMIIRPKLMPGPAPRSSPFQRLIDGLRYAQQQGRIVPLLLNATVINILGIGALQTLLPAFAAVALNTPKAGYAALSAAISAGSILGAALIVPLGSQFGRDRITATTAALWTGLTVVFAITNSLVVAVILAFILGFVYTVFFVTSNTLLQTHTEEVYRGRVMALWSLNRFALAPIGALIIGIFANLIGTPVTLILCAGMGVVMLLILRFG